MLWSGSKSLPQESVLMRLSCLWLDSLWLVAVYRCFHFLSYLSSSLCLCPGYSCPTFPRIPSASPGQAGSDQFTVKQVKKSEQCAVPGVVSVNRKWLILVWCKQTWTDVNRCSPHWEKDDFMKQHISLMVPQLSANIRSALWLHLLHSCLLAEVHSEAHRITSGSFLKVIRLS